MFKRSLSVFLACILILSALCMLFSCADSGDKPEQPDEPGTQDTPDTPDEPDKPQPDAVPAPDIPDTLKGGGESIVIQLEGWANYAPLDIVDVGITERNNDSLNDAAYQRDRQIEEMLDVMIETRVYPEYAPSQAELTRLVNSGSCDVDLCLMRTAAFTSAVTGHLLSDLDRATLQYFDESAPYWDQNSFAALSIADVHYGLTGDFSVADDATYWCVFFNKQMVADYQLDSPYEVVKAGDWTYDEMYAMGEDVAADLDGVEGPTFDDRFGISMIRDVLAGALNTCGVTIVEKDKNDLPVPSFYTDDHVDILLDLLEIFYDKDVVYNVHVQGGDEVEIFTNGNVLFTFGGMYYGPQMRSADMEFGILPMPKYDADDAYISATSPLFLSILTLPQSDTNSDDLKSAFMQMYAYLGSQQVVPEYHDRLLKYKITRDEESRDMLEYVFGNTVYDIGGMFNFADFSFDLINMMYTYDSNIASLWARKETPINTAIEQLLDALEQ